MAWLRRVPENGTRVDDHRSDPNPKRPPALEDAGRASYTCQFTQLSAASRPLSRWDVRQDLRPLLNGNLTLRAFLVGMFTRVFNRLDRFGGGSGYPPLARSTRKTTPPPDLSLSPGQPVRVLGGERIAKTLDGAGRNRGLTFDREMLKHCGQHCCVSKRVDRIIEVGTGRLLAMKTPCLVLEGVDNSGEFLRFWPQHEPLYWREVWLEPDGTNRNVGAESRSSPPPANTASASVDGTPRPAPIAGADRETGRDSPGSR
jgi:hypothetical protein